MIVRYDYDVNGNRTSMGLSSSIEKKEAKPTVISVGRDSSQMPKLGPMDVPTTKTETANNAENAVAQVKIGEQEIAIYPNPTRNLLTIDLKNFNRVTSCSVEILDATYKMVYKSTSAQQIYTIDLSNHPAGNYTVNLQVNGQSGTYTVIKQ